MNTISTSTGAITTSADSTKLASLLALATSAVAMPQTGQADIIYTDLSSSPASVTYNSAPFWFTVPGAAQVGFFGRQTTATTTPYSVLTYKYRLVVAGVSQGIAGGVGGNGNLAQHLPFGATWDQPLASFYNIPVAAASDGGGVFPNAGYNNRFLAWFFYDDTPGIEADRFGWVEINLSVAGYNLGGPTVTVLRYAYDNTGAKPTMGQMPVPEPTSGALLVLGALAMGARGLRKWRLERQSIKQA